MYWWSTFVPVSSVVDFDGSDCGGPKPLSMLLVG